MPDPPTPRHCYVRSSIWRGRWGRLAWFWPTRSSIASAIIRKHRHIRDHLGADSIIPAKRGKRTWRLHGIRAQMRATFPTARYRQRTLVESVFSSAKRKLSSRAPGRLPVTQHLQVLLLGLAYDIYRVRRALTSPLV